MSLDTLGPNQLTLTRPDDPHDPNGYENGRTIKTVGR
jgi:hypothetical protein